MGELATPTPADRRATLALAHEVVAAVTNEVDCIRVDDFDTLRLCQDLVDTRRALEAACKALDGQDIDPDGVWAARLWNLDLTEDE
jgi:hypothetical protein